MYVQSLGYHGDPMCACSGANHFMKHDPADYVHDYYTVEIYLKAYSYGLERINGQKMWPKGVGYPVEPPLVRIMPGRPKKKRRRGQDERNPNNPAKLRKIGVRITCQKCLQQGHNSRGCKNDPVEKPQRVQVCKQLQNHIRFVHLVILL